jgi:exopolysaccharide biosynthesis protein
MSRRILNVTSAPIVFTTKRAFVILLCLLCVLGGGSTAQDFKKTVHPGVEYAQIDHKIGNDPVKINLLRLDLTKVRLDVHHALDAAIGTEKTSSIATRHGAVAAINAGFFRLDKSQFAGDSVGTLMIDGRLLSESSNGRVNLILWEEKKGPQAVFEHFDSSTTLEFGFEEGPQPIYVTGVNRERRAGDIILYDRLVGDKFSAEHGGTEIVLSKCKPDKDGWDLSIITCRRVEVKSSPDDSPIPSDGFVLSVASDAKQSKLVLSEIATFQKLPRGKQKIILRNTFRNGNNYFLFDDTTDVVAGVPQLIRNSKIDITWEQEKAGKSFVEMRHPRTAVAKLKDGKFLMMTVDGRQPGVSVGMSLYELADYLLSLGAKDAMNLDGGGSTTMFLDGNVVNKPSDKEGERKVSDTILVTLRKSGRR